MTSTIAGIINRLVVKVTRQSLAWFLAVTLAAATIACESKKKGAEISVALSPAAVDVLVTKSVQFTAEVRNSTDRGVVWSLAGASCSGAACGTISSSGLYTAPEVAPNPSALTVKATSVADPSKSSYATITVFPMANVWTWVSGSNTANQTGDYGARGTAAQTNHPGARLGAVSWSDPAGNLWVFGGYGWDAAGWSDLLNDLWKYDPVSKEWTWIAGGQIIDQPGVYGTCGVPSPANVPGARWLAVSWTGADGKLWLFGGRGFVGDGEYGDLNDLWRYDPASGEWTWMSGSNTRFQPGAYGTRGVADAANVPGGRWEAVSWIDPGGKLWLFGGEGYDSAGDEADLLNDLWRFDPETLEWTWISGSPTADQLGRYGTKGVPDPLNAPGARGAANAWVDPQGNLWLFGGRGWGPEHSYIPGMLNDLWRFDRTSEEWTWVSGSDTLNQPGAYGTKGASSASNVPGGRHWAYFWTNAGGQFYLFAGYGYYAGAQAEGCLNDLWRYDPQTSEWTWLSGSSGESQAGSYGLQGEVALTNVPGSRNSGIVWVGPEDHIWLFGGHGYYADMRDGYLNDVWRYDW